MNSSEKPLSGLNIMVTRSGKQAGSLSEKLKERGANVIEMPVIAFLPPMSWEPLDTAIKQIHTYNWIVFASVNAVDAFFSRAQALRARIKGVKIAAIGPATEEALRKHQSVIDFRPSSFIAESMVEEFPGYPELSGLRILWPRNNVGRKLIIEKFTQAKATVDAVEAYRTALPENEKELAKVLVDLLQSGGIDVITLASSQTAMNLARLITEGITEGMADRPVRPLSDLLSSTAIATIGPETSHTAKEHLGKVTVEAQEYTVDGLVEAICRFRRGGD